MVTKSLSTIVLSKKMIDFHLVSKTDDVLEEYYRNRPGEPTIYQPTKDWTK